MGEWSDAAVAAGREAEARDPGSYDDRMRAALHEFALSGQHLRGRAWPDQRTEIRLRLVKRQADADLLDRFSKLLNQLVRLRRFGDDQPPCTGTALPGSDVGRFDDLHHRASHVGHVVHDQRVVATHFQSQHLLGLAG